MQEENLIFIVPIVLAARPCMSLTEHSQLAATKILELQPGLSSTPPKSLTCAPEAGDRERRFLKLVRSRNLERGTCCQTRTALLFAQLLKAPRSSPLDPPPSFRGGRFWLLFDICSCLVSPVGESWDWT